MDESTALLNPTEDTPAPIKTVSEMLAERNFILATANEIQLYRTKVSNYSSDLLRDYDPEEFRKMVDTNFWQSILERSSICAGMTENEKGKFQREMRADPPPFDAEHVKAFADNAARIFTEGIQHTLKIVFQSFTNTEYSRDWRNKKIDNCRKIEKTFRCQGGIYHDGSRCSPWRYRDGFSTGYYSSTWPCFNDLLTACRILDCKPAPNYSNNFSQIFREQSKEFQRFGSTASASPVIVTDYFTVRCFKNGNQLVTFTREDILDLLNQYGASGQLPEGFRKKYKPEHFNREEERMAA